MARNSSIRVRFRDAGALAGGDAPAYEIESVDGPRAAVSLAYDRGRVATLVRALVVLAISVGIGWAILGGTQERRRSIRVPLGTAAAPPTFDDLTAGQLAGDAETITDEVLAQDLLAMEDAPAPDAPPPQDLLDSLPDLTVGPAPATATTRAPSAVLIFDAGTGDGAPVIGSVPNRADAGPPVPAGRTPTTLLPPGAVVPVILETAIAPAKPSAVRAIVNAQVAGARRGEVAIPKSSRLLGQYQSKDVGGKQRVYIVWKRIILPDGTSREIVSGSVSKANFFDTVATASMVSAIDAPTSGSDSDRVRPGEPLQIVTTRSVEITK